MIPIYKPWITDLEKEYVNKAVASGWISSQGEYIELFEQKISEYLNVKYAASTNNGTSACHIALAACDIGPGDEVIVPDCTYIATANAVKYCGATPVLADVCPNTWNINLEIIEKYITNKTKAIFCVHLLGNPCNYLKLEEIKNKYNLLIIEDAAEAFSAEYLNKKTGSWFDAAAFSFFGNKTITTGEGGVVVTNNPEIDRKARLFKGQGQTNRYFHPVIGYNYRMTNLAAALGCAQLDRVQEILKEKERVYTEYSLALKDSFIQQRKISEEYKHGNWMFGVKLNKKTQNSLKNQQYFDTRPLFQTISSMPPYSTESDINNIISEQLSKQVVMLPSYPELTNLEINNICEIIKNNE